MRSEWEAMFSEARLRTRGLAVARRRRGEKGAVAFAAAAAFHLLPLYRVRSDKVSIIEPTAHPRRNAGDIIRHQMPLAEADVVVIDGVRVTSLDRTVYDVIRMVSLEAAICVFDAALRQCAWDDSTRTYDVEAAEGFRGKVVRRIRANTGARGIKQARLVAELADGRAQLPGESISRLWMWQLGLPEPELQYRVDFPDGTFALLDFAWPALGRWAEFDGDVKYTDATFMGGRSAEEVLYRQHEREQKVRRVTSWTPGRWGFDRMPDIDTFAAHLRAIGLRG